MEPQDACRSEAMKEDDTRQDVTTSDAARSDATRTDLASGRIGYVCGLLHEIHAIDIRWLDVHATSGMHPKDMPNASRHYGIGETVTERGAWVGNRSGNPIGPTPEVLIRQAQGDARWGKAPILLQTPLRELYVVLSLPECGGDAGGTESVLLVGPVLGSDVSPALIDRLLAEGGHPMRLKPALVRHSREVPRLEYTAVCRVAMLLWLEVLGKRLDLLSLLEGGDSGVDALQQYVGGLAESKVLENRRQAFRHHSTQYENLLLDSIRKGDPVRLEKNLRDHPMDGTPGVLSRGDPLRSIRNSMICLIALATRAAVEGGLHYEYAFTISDEYIQRIEETSTQEETFRIGMAALRELAVRVRDIAENGCSQAVERCRAHLFRNLYGEVRTEELARIAGMSEARLMTRFREETGLTPHQWMIRERVREAQRLLRTGTDSITDISIALNFHDVSHFCKTFRRVAGVSPAQWRKAQT